jgi:hypothetical protein
LGTGLPGRQKLPGKEDLLEALRDEGPEPAEGCLSGPGLVAVEEWRDRRLDVPRREVTRLDVPRRGVTRLQGVAGRLRALLQGKEFG